MNRPRLLRWRHALALRIAPWLKREDGWIAVKDGRGLAHVLSYDQWRKLRTFSGLDYYSEDGVSITR